MYLDKHHFYQHETRYRMRVPTEKHGPMILDNARNHLANLPGEHLERNNHIMLEFPPSYSPEKNSIERVWRFVKSKGTRNRYFLSIGELIWAVTQHFDMYSKQILRNYLVRHV